MLGRKHVTTRGVMVRILMEYWNVPFHFHGFYFLPTQIYFFLNLIFFIYFKLIVLI